MSSHYCYEDHTSLDPECESCLELEKVKQGQILEREMWANSGWFIKKIILTDDQRDEYLDAIHEYRNYKIYGSVKTIAMAKRLKKYLSEEGRYICPAAFMGPDLESLFCHI
jgi:hypothetical protein